MTTHTPANRRRSDAQESLIMEKLSAVDLICLGAIRRAVEEMK